MLQAAQKSIHCPPTQSSPAINVAMCATGRSGLGHLRRITNIAAALKQVRPDSKLQLVSNAPVAAMHEHEQALFENCVLAERGAMAHRAEVGTSHITVVDTAILPGLHECSGKLCLVLRETMPSKLQEFRLAGGRKWDLVLVPNPAGHWRPDADAIGTKRAETVGWIYRQPDAAPDQLPSRAETSAKRILIASGGGGNNETSHYIADQCRQIATELRRHYRQPLHIVQAAGPRLPADCIVELCDEVVDPGARLNELFGTFDLIISTAGYNSVLELAQTDRPVILLPISRSYDDQLERVAKWAAQLGYAHQRDQAHATAKWAADMLESNYLRHACELGPSGADRAAALLVELTS